MHILSDLGITALCLGSSVYIYLWHHRRSRTPSQWILPVPGYILTNQVTHARLLPAESKHSFTYPTISLLVSLSPLESGALNRGWRGWVFGYPGLTRICGLRPRTYLTDCSGLSHTSSPTIRAKLVELLKSTGVQLGEVWMMTMPSFLGFEGINPLTVYFCYEQGQTQVWGVVLEVHNTFGERHAYVLQVGKGEDYGDEKPKGYDHQWTIPRQFHVSPFNDRSGHYVCSVVAPSHPPPTPGSESPANPPPRPIVDLRVLTAPPSSQPKLTAAIRTVVSEPLTARSLLSALVLPPLVPNNLSPISWFSLPLGATLVLTAVRILYHAARLHYQRGLVVFARPEPIAGVGREWVEEALGGVWNDVQPTEQESPVEKVSGGSIGWQAESSTERWAREMFEMRFGVVAAEMGVRVKIASADPMMPITTLGDGKNTLELVLCYRSPRTWTALFLAPTAKHALELGSQTERWFAVSNEELFTELWYRASPEMQNFTWATNIIRAIRERLTDLPTSTSSALSLPLPPHPPHPLDSPESFAPTFHASILYLMFHVERLIFGLARARFLWGDAPWRVQDRVGRAARVGAGGVGSLIQ